jgi:dihydrofolate reductase
VERGGPIEGPPREPTPRNDERAGTKGDMPSARSTPRQGGRSMEGSMRKLIVHEFVTLDGVIQAPGGKDEDLDGGFQHGGWTIPYWHDDIGKTFVALMQGVDALLLGRRTYVTHATAFEPMPPGDPFGDLMNAPKKFVVSKTLDRPIWRDTTIIRESVIEAVRALKAQPGKNIVTDGSSQLVHALLAHDLVDELYLSLYPLTLGGGKRALPSGVHATFALTSATPYPSGVVGLHYSRRR